MLEAAYNDSAGVTARFNRNILQVINDRLGADFDPSAFDHVVFYDEENAWIEMPSGPRPAAVRIPAAGLDQAIRHGRRDPHRDQLRVHASPWRSGCGDRG